MSNSTPPKEIWINQAEIDCVNVMSLSDLRLDPFGEVSFIKGQYIEEIKYLSEESVKEMLAEKDRRINNLLERIKFRDDQIDIDANSILSMNADLKAKDKEIERLKVSHSLIEIKLKGRENIAETLSDEIERLKSEIENKDKEIERLKEINEEVYNNGYANGQLDLIID